MVMDALAIAVAIYKVQCPEHEKSANIIVKDINKSMLRKKYFPDASLELFFNSILRTI